MLFFFFFFAVLGCVHTFSLVLLVQKKEDTFSPGSLDVHTVFLRHKYHKTTQCYFVTEPAECIVLGTRNSSVAHSNKDLLQADGVSDACTEL